MLVAWFRQKEAPLPPPSTPATPLDVGPPERGLPQAGQAEFVVTDVFTVTGEGLILAGRMQRGSIAVPTLGRLLPGPGSPAVPCPVEVVEALVQHQRVSQLGPGPLAGLRMRGIERVDRHRWRVQ